MIYSIIKRALATVLVGLMASCSYEDSVSQSSAAPADDRPASSTVDGKAASVVSSSKSFGEPGASASQTESQEKQLVRDPSYLKTEARFVSEKGLSTYATNEVLGSHDGFRSALDEMRRDASRSMEAQDMTDLIRTALERAVGKDAAVTGFSCGLTVCMGTVRVRSEVKHERWVMKFLNDGSFRVFGFLDVAEKVGGTYESRFIFSTDPDVPGIYIPN